ncbi:MAG: 3-dehydroquinate synthase [Actinomycetota bacterium]|jgi:3-dehydroquinate synthase|nr:3-dehydroquinate synthase [Actinomycetota bacterium]
MTAPTRITVGGVSPYDVVVGAGALGELPALLSMRPRQVLVVHSPVVAELAADVAGALLQAGIEVTKAVVPDGEAAKTVDVCADVWSLLGRRGFTRSDAVVSVGGGAVTDLAGFVAASWLRGVRVVHVPTTLLGMVDAAVGGKTAVNTAEGKNLVGAFYPPAGVLCDLTTLTTLPRGELASGMAEVVKAGFLRDGAILELVEADPARALDPRGPELRELVERAVRFKADVVAGDLREHGGREILNYGHTLGHAIEKVESFRWRHGDAVSVGLVFAAELAAVTGRLGADEVLRHRSVLGALGLPTSYRHDAWPALREAMTIDKKSRGERLRFVVLDGLGRPGLLEDPDESLLELAYAEVSA